MSKRHLPPLPATCLASSSSSSVDISCMSSMAAVMRQRLHGQLHVAVLTAAAGLLDMFVLAFGGLQNRLAIGHLRAAHVRLHAELAHHAVDDNFQMQLAHAGNQRLARIVHRCERGRWDLPAPACRARCPFFPGPLWSWARSRRKSPASGNRCFRERWAFLRRHSVSPVVTFFRPTHAAISPASIDSISSRLFACMRSRRPMRSRVFLRRVVNGLSGLQHAGIDANVRHVADVRIGHDLERQRRKRLIVRRAAQAPASSRVRRPRLPPAERRPATANNRSPHRAAAARPCS